MANSVHFDNVVNNFHTQVNLNTKRVDQPTIAPNGGAGVGYVTVILTSTPGADIYYTLDGSVTFDTATLYTGPFNITTTATLWCVAALAGFTVSHPALANFIIT